jgi:hypothetical protein
LAFGSAKFITGMIKGGRRELTLALTFLLVIAAIAFFVVLGWDTVRRVFQIVVFGIGLGSHRPNNVIMTLL